MSDYLFDCVIFDLDGVITKTAVVHGKAWKATFDEYLKMREERDGESFREFTHEDDYLPFVDGKPRYKGVESFLKSRGIDIPFGEPTDMPDAETACGIGNKKNEMFTKFLKEDGAQVFESTIEFIRALKAAGIKVGVASSSKNCKVILESAGYLDLFGTRIDGVVSAELKLKGKPEADIFVVAANELGSVPAKTVVVEDAVSGVAAGRNGGFGLVLGVAREDNTQELFDNGADLVVSDLSEINMDIIGNWFKRQPKDLFANWDECKKCGCAMAPALYPCGTGDMVNPRYKRPAKEIFAKGKKIVFYLDYDGTLTPIVSRPDLAVLTDEMRDVVRELSKKYMVSIVSGRMREDVENLVGIKELLYAGSHGFDIRGADFSMVEPAAEKVIPVVSEIIAFLKEQVGGIEGVLIEEKKFSTAVHYRLCSQDVLPQIKQAVDDVVSKYKEVRLMCGKMVYEILPNIEWDKGKAIRWIMQALKLNWEDVSVVYIGDDVTDEFAFRAIRSRGTGILVGEEERPSAAQFSLKSPDDVRKLFEDLVIGN